MNKQDEHDKLAQQVLTDCLAKAIAAETGDALIAVINKNIDEFNFHICAIDKAAAGRTADGRSSHSGAHRDVYTQGAPLPTAEDPQYKTLVDAYVAAHPGVSRADALNQILQLIGRTPHQHRVAA
jgi:hypothetical protein